MRIGSTRSLVTAFTAVTLAMSGCGSSPKPLTRADLTARANSICKTVSARLAAATKSGVSNQQDLARVAPELAGFEQTALTQLSKLVPPAELERDWKQFVAGAQTLAENTAKLGEYAKTNNLKAGRSLIVSTEAIQKQMVAIAKRDALKNCEQVP